VKYKNPLVFAELMLEFLVENEKGETIDSFLDEHIFLISSSNPWYRVSLIYLQTSRETSDDRSFIWKKIPHYCWHFVSARGGFDPSTLLNS
jgi:hypothetical protein